jgi:quaternary ammonium compound-resistance protein SugE
MAWIILIVSGMFETVWAVALGKSAGFSRLVPSLVFGGALIVSMGGLAIAMRTLPIGTSYAVWVAVGAALTVTYSMVTGDESVSILKVVLLLGLIGCVVGLKLAN